MSGRLPGAVLLQPLLLICSCCCCCSEQPPARPLSTTVFYFHPKLLFTFANCTNRHVLPLRHVYRVGLYKMRRGFKHFVITAFVREKLPLILHYVPLRNHLQRQTTRAQQQRKHVHINLLFCAQIPQTVRPNIKKNRSNFENAH